MIPTQGATKGAIYFLKCSKQYALDNPCYLDIVKAAEFLDRLYEAGYTAEDLERLAAMPAGFVPDRYRFEPCPKDGGIYVTDRGAGKWAVQKDGNGGPVLAKDGEWEFEPSPSNRDDEFKARCRFDGPIEAALAAISKITEAGNG